MQQNEILQKFHEMEQRYKKLKRAISIASFLVIFSLITFGFTRTESFQLIRTKGIIIEDENGRDRILIGAPIPISKDRVRDDTALVRKYFAKTILPKNPDLYMKYYQSYKNSAFGMVVMNEKGIDIVQLGDKLSDANTGRRQFENSGLLWNAQNGTELGGVGVNTLPDGKSRVVFGFDDPSDGGSEALHTGVMEDGSRMLIMRDNNGSLVLGLGKPNNPFFQNNDTTTFVGIKYFDKKGKLVWEQKMNKPDTKK